MSVTAPLTGGTWYVGWIEKTRCWPPRPPVSGPVTYNSTWDIDVPAPTDMQPMDTWHYSTGYDPSVMSIADAIKASQ